MKKMKAFGDRIPFFWGEQIVQWSKALPSCKAISAVPAANPLKVHQFLNNNKAVLITKLFISTKTHPRIDDLTLVFSIVVIQ